MNRIYKNYFYCCLTFSLCFAGCSKFVTVAPPVTQLVTTSVFSNNSSATSAQTAIYSQMAAAEMYNLAVYTGFSSDELTNYYSSPEFTATYSNTLDVTNAGGVATIWTAAYSYIYQANAVIEGLQNNAGVDAAVKQQLTGEAKLVRAFWSFYLINLFGDIPLLTSTDYKVNSAAARTSVADVYQQIIVDLKNAQSLLNPDFVDPSSVAISADRVRPTSWAASALLARAYLYSGDYKNAEIQATSVINNTTLFSLNANLDSVFLMNSSEAIWQLMPSTTTGYNTTEGELFILTSAPGPNNPTGISTSVSNQLLSAFEPGDSRRGHWIDSIIVDTTTYYFPYKYKNNTPAVTEYTMVLRLAEQYLIRAEARAEQGDVAGAAGDLNTIRNRAGLNNTTATDMSSLLTAISQERQVELFTEGHRWLDLKRTKTVDAVMTVVTPQKGGSPWSSYQQLYPLPLTDLQTDPNLTQNKGY